MRRANLVGNGSQAGRSGWTKGFVGLMLFGRLNRCLNLKFDDYTADNDDRDNKQRFENATTEAAGPGDMVILHRPNVMGRRLRVKLQPYSPR